MPRPIRVMIVDDSAYVRLVVARMLRSDPRIEVIGEARDGQEALDKVEQLAPDVITLDVEMPRRNGLETLRALLPKRPIPVVMLSSLTQRGAQVTLEALRLGAVDFVGKPGSAGVPDLEAVRQQILSKVRAAALARVPAPAMDVVGAADRRSQSPPPPSSRPRRSGSAVFPTVLIASSTGGPAALHTVIGGLSSNLPAAVAITQHMPPSFTEALARRLDQHCAIEVRQAEEGDFLRPGLTLVAPGDHHMLIGPRGVIHLSSEPPMWGVRPAADPMMASAAESLRGPLVGVVLTGMGQDGANGVRAIARAGGVCIAESEETAVIFGMPKAAQQTGCCSAILPLGQIPARIEKLVLERAAA